MPDTTRADREKAFQNALVFGGAPGAVSPETALETATSAAKQAKVDQRKELQAAREDALSNEDNLTGSYNASKAGVATDTGPQLGETETKAALGQAVTPLGLAKMVGVGSGAMSPEALAAFIAKQGGAPGPAPSPLLPPGEAAAPPPSPVVAPKLARGPSGPGPGAPPPAATGGSGAPLPEAPGPAPEEPTTTPAAPAKSPDELAYEAAQKEANSSKGRLLAADILGSFTSNPERLWKGIEEQRQAPYRKLAEKAGFLQTARENAAKNVKAQHEAEVTDPNSASTKRNAAMLYAAYGIKAPKGFTAEQTADYVAASKLKGEEKDKALSRLRDEARDKEAGRHNRAEEAQQRYATNATLEKERIAREAAKHATTPALAAELPKVSNISGADPAIRELMAQHAKIGPIEKTISALTGGALNIGDAGKYQRLKDTKVGPLATALYPLAKGENPALLKSAEEQLPGVAGFESTAQDKLRQLKRTTAETKENFISGLEAAGLDPAQAARLRAVGGGGQPQVLQTVKKGGKQYSQLDDGSWVEH